jgi:large subunit ribosomal protein L13
LEKKPTLLIENAIKGMLPKGKLGRSVIKKLFVYEGGEHPHVAQKPQPLSF